MTSIPSRCHVDMSNRATILRVLRIRNAISIGGDSDTLAAITGSIAEAVWGVPEKIEGEALRRLDESLFASFQRFVSGAAD